MVSVSVIDRGERVYHPSHPECMGNFVDFEDLLIKLYVYHLDLFWAAWSCDIISLHFVEMQYTELYFLSHTSVLVLSTC